MPESTAVNAFVNELHLKLEYFRAEFDLTYAEAIGCLELVKQELVLQVIEVAEACEEDDEDER